MDIEIFINNLVQKLFLPPGMNMALMLAGLILIRRFYVTGKIFIILGFISLIIFSLPITAQGLNLILEQNEVLTPDKLKKTKAGAIIVLGAGRYSNALEYPDTDSISKNALERLRYGVYLHKKSNIPLLVTGGNPHGELISEASIMQKALNDIFQLKAKWIEPKSSNTWNNARYSFELLKKHNIKNIILVTHADHMPRSVMAFEHFGFEVTTAPLGFKAKNKGDGYTIMHFLPSAYAMNQCNAAMHEFIGYLWYLLRYKGFN